MELLNPNQYQEYEEFVRNHPRSALTQSVLWQGVKSGWAHEVVVLRDSEGAIEAGLSILIRKVPGLGTTMMYAPRGPICDYTKYKELLPRLQVGIDELAQKHNAHVFKMDPDLNVGEGDFLETCKEMGYARVFGPTGFETIQTRFNYRLYFQGRSEEEMLMNMQSKTRYNVRLAGRRGVTIRVGGKEDLGDFMHLMEITGDRDEFSIRSQEYFEIMLDQLGEHVRLYLADYEGKVISGAITSNYGGKTNYMYGCSDNGHRNTMSTYLMQWEMIRWGLETGCSVYDFMGVGGDLNQEDPLYGLYRFKSGFNGVLEEAVGELDYVYKPFVNKLVDVGLSLNQWIRDR